MASVPEIILDNPFRVLGVYANSSYREIVASVSKAAKFMEVGRKVDYPLDLRNVKNLYVASNLKHSLENLDNALAQLSNSEERLKYAQFWFLRMTPLDDEAFEHLFAGAPNHALAVWNREDNLSSLQNRLIIYLWKGNLKKDLTLALQSAEKLYTLFPEQFLKAVDSKGTLVKSSADLAQSFVDTLLGYISPIQLLDTLPSPFWLDYIVPTISEGAFTKIDSAIHNAKDQLDMLNTEGRKVESVLPNIGIGGKLLYDIKNDLNVLNRVSSSDNPRLHLTSDQLADVLYECSIDEYNIRDFAPEYALHLLQKAFELSNNSVDQEEINNKIALFQKKVDDNKKETQLSAFSKLGCLFFALLICIIIQFIIIFKACH